MSRSRQPRRAGRSSNKTSAYSHDEDDELKAISTKIKNNSDERVIAAMINRFVKHVDNQVDAQNQPYSHSLRNLRVLFWNLVQDRYLPGVELLVSKKGFPFFGSSIKEAIVEADLDVIDFLLQSGMSPNMECEKGFPLLYYAIKYKSPAKGYQGQKIVDILLERKADANSRIPYMQKQIPILHLAAIHGDLKSMRSLIQNGANVAVLAPPPYGDNTADRLNIIDYMLDLHDPRISNHSKDKGKEQPIFQDTNTI
jgi:hypothetical protein